MLQEFSAFQHVHVQKKGTVHHLQKFGQWLPARRLQQVHSAAAIGSFSVRCHIGRHFVQISLTISIVYRCQVDVKLYRSPFSTSILYRFPFSFCLCRDIGNGNWPYPALLRGGNPCYKGFSVFQTFSMSMYRSRSGNRSATSLPNWDTA